MLLTALTGATLASTVSAVLVLFFLESMLSVDNAAVLAVMVSHLPDKLQPRALRYGLLGAYLMRFGAMAIAVQLAAMKPLMVLGGFYLLYLAYKHFTTNEADEAAGLEGGWTGWVKNTFGVFWGTVILVEIADMIFSIDNVFAAAAMAKEGQQWMLYVGVGLGILTMRFVAQRFVVLMKRFPRLETSAYVVIGLLGIKLLMTGITGWLGQKGYWPEGITIEQAMHSEIFDAVFSFLMLIVFFFPVATQLYRNKVSTSSNV